VVDILEVKPEIGSRIELQAVDPTMSANMIVVSGKRSAIGLVLKADVSVSSSDPSERNGEMSLESRA
jgi:hypothetical protein